MRLLRPPFWMSTRLLPAFSVLLVLPACENVPKLLPESYLIQESSLQFAQMKQQATVSRDPKLQAQVDRVGKRLVQAAGNRLPAYEWEFVVFQDESVNAFAMPGGKVGVHTGLFSLVASDDELAAVLGHEITHVMEQHANERMTVALAQAAVGAAVGAAASRQDRYDPKLIMAAYGLGSTYAAALPFGRFQEYEADTTGLLLMAQAGYDPQAAISFWKKMQSSSGGQPPEFLSSHPSHGNRIERLQETMPEALSLYRANLPSGSVTREIGR